MITLDSRGPGLSPALPEQDPSELTYVAAHVHTAQLACSIICFAHVCHISVISDIGAPRSQMLKFIPVRTPCVETRATMLPCPHRNRDGIHLVSSEFANLHFTSIE